MAAIEVAEVGHQLLKLLETCALLRSEIEDSESRGEQPDPDLVEAFDENKEACAAKRARLTSFAEDQPHVRNQVQKILDEADREFEKVYGNASKEVEGSLPARQGGVPASAEGGIGDGLHL